MVILFDVDNTLLDNDAVISDLRDYLVQQGGADCAGEYFRLFEELRAELGYADYLGTLQRFRTAHPRDFRLLRASQFLVEYPFRERLYPNALAAVAGAAAIGTTAILSDGDVVFQPLKVERSGCWEAVRGRVLIYVHKERELGDVERQLPAEHYVMIDDKRRLLGAIKAAWGARVTTVWVRQGHYATAADVERYAPADVELARIGDFRALTAGELLAAARPAPGAAT
jgi:FMN phosphatase YigB (HAD superfamily)